MNALIQEQSRENKLKILFLFYEFIFIIGLFLYLPIYLFKRKINIRAFFEKLGFFYSLEAKDSIWVHAVSVGEVNLIEKLVLKIREIYNYPIVISTTTLTGNSLAKKKYSKFAKVIFFPFDISFALKRVIKKVKPKIFVGVETELWPNLFFYLYKKKIPIVLINGRISEKAFRSYKKISYFMKEILDKCTYIGVQNKYYKERFISLGCKEGKIFITGNMKFESISFDEKYLNQIRDKYLALIKPNNSLLIIAASTHYPEEKLFLDIYKDILKVEKNLSLIIAPRHIERIPSVEKIIFSLGFEPIKISELFSSNKISKNSVFLLDTLGTLIYFYAISDICFVGGSLAKYGGHNILEPLYFSKPTIFGPYMDNFKDIEELVLEKNAAIKIKNILELKEYLLNLIRDRNLREGLGLRAKEIFIFGENSLEKNLELILKCIK